MKTKMKSASRCVLVDPDTFNAIQGSPITKYYRCTFLHFIKWSSTPFKVCLHCQNQPLFSFMLALITGDSPIALIAHTHTHKKKTDLSDETISKPCRALHVAVLPESPGRYWSPSPVGGSLVCTSGPLRPCVPASSGTADLLPGSQALEKVKNWNIFIRDRILTDVTRA